LQRNLHGNSPENRAKWSQFDGWTGRLLSPVAA
jgi:hypothetical protein